MGVGRRRVHVQGSSGWCRAVWRAQPALRPRFGGSLGIGGAGTGRTESGPDMATCCLAALLWAARQKTSEQASHGGGGPAALASVALRALRAPLSEPAFAKTGAHFPARCSAAASPSVLWCVCVCECGQ